MLRNAMTLVSQGGVLVVALPLPYCSKVLLSSQMPSLPIVLLRGGVGILFIDFYDNPLLRFFAAMGGPL